MNFLLGVALIALHGPQDIPVGIVHVLVPWVIEKKVNKKLAMFKFENEPYVSFFKCFVSLL